MRSKRPIKVLIAKPGLDGHDRGAKILVRLLRDAGMEVVYTGLRQSIPTIVRTAVQEDVDVIGLSIMSGGAIHFTAELLEKLREYPEQGFVVVIGGVIAREEEEDIRAMGVEGLFPVGTPGEKAIEFIQRRLSDTINVEG